MNKKIIFGAFISGMVLMIFEMAGARIIGPYFGTSMYVWSSIIGVIMASLSLGYWYGGKMADIESSVKSYALKFIYSAVSLLLVFLLKDYTLYYISISLLDLKLSALLSGFLLFGLPSFFFGTISPFAIKLLLKNVDETGKTTGNLYAISTLGSIIGTFLGGFYLVPTFGINNVLIFCIILMGATGALLYIEQFKKIIAIIIIALLYNFYIITNSDTDVKTFISEYSNISVYENIDNKTNKKLKHLLIDNSLNSSMYIDSEELVYDYLKYYRLDQHFYPNFSDVLMIGGGSCSYPKDLLSKNKNVKIDVVEIDKKIIDIAYQEFRLPKSDRLNFYYEDARTFLNRNQKKYNIIYGDAFNALYSIPFQLTTKEAVQKIYNSLDKNGTTIINIISTDNQDENLFLRAELSTFKSIFPYTYLFKVTHEDSNNPMFNFCLVASKKEIKLQSENTELNSYLSTIIRKELKPMPVLTDNKAPVEKYINMMH